MATTNTTAGTNGQAKQPMKFSTEEDRKIRATAEEARAAGRPADFPRWRLIEVLKDGKPVGYTWVPHPDHGIIRAAKRDGYVAAELGKGASKEKAGAILAALCPEDRTAVLAQYLPAKKSGK
jgi:hypothetical protein